MAEPNVEEIFIEEPPVVIVISDARGKTAAGVVEAAAAQFEEGVISIKQVGNVRSVETVKDYLDKHNKENADVAVFHTIVDQNLRREIRRELDARGIPSIDLLGPSITIIATLTGEEPVYQTGRRTKVQIEEA
ncbi:MAG: kinase/pyrophosphorylase [Coriobacteriales bacterium]|nr:kinase/pyrophosphorylase [Coriobacteriales bacterium]MDO5709151.1 kinase/pyrophosphorylase [Coriobacteriales bacterium]